MMQNAMVLIRVIRVPWASNSKPIQLYVVHQVGLDPTDDADQRPGRDRRVRCAIGGEVRRLIIIQRATEDIRSGMDVCVHEAAAQLRTFPSGCIALLHSDMSVMIPLTAGAFVRQPDPAGDSCGTA
jgi:hypothetical protein